MRRYPTASTGSFRQVVDPAGYQLTAGIRLEEGAWILLNIYALQNSEKIWGPDAKEFKPERFLATCAEGAAASAGGGRARLGTEEDPLDVNDAHHKDTTTTTTTATTTSTTATTLSAQSAFAGAGLQDGEVCFAPFSFGMRNCVGMNLALMELRVGLGMLLTRFNFELADPAMQDDENMFETHFTSRARDGLPVLITRRK
jgi:cytochrome P450